MILYCLLCHVGQDSISATERDERRFAEENSFSDQSQSFGQKGDAMDDAPVVFFEGLTLPCEDRNSMRGGHVQSDDGSNRRNDWDAHEQFHGR